MGRYSNRTDLLKRLDRTQRLARSTSARPKSTTSRIHAVARRLDEGSRQQLIDAYVGGAPSTVLMERYDLGKGTVLGILRRAGVEIRNKGLKSDDLARAMLLYESGLSLKGAASHVGCDPETVRKALRAAGVTMRKPWGGPG